jgi:hypothetical protein
MQCGARWCGCSTAAEAVLAGRVLQQDHVTAQRQHGQRATGAQDLQQQAHEHDRVEGVRTVRPAVVLMVGFDAKELESGRATDERQPDRRDLGRLCITR